MNVLILGASGLVGGNCLNHFKEKGWNCLGTHFSFETADTESYNTLDPSQQERQMVADFNPGVIVHCGALTWVDYCEEHPDESWEKTVKSTQNAVELATTYNAQLVYLSSDYVFDGTKGFYVEGDDVQPLNVYGKHKLEAEQLIWSLKNSLICRITNVYGDEIRGKNFIARLSENMSKGEPMDLKLPIDQYATPVNAWDVARAIGRLVENQLSGLYHLASTDYLNRVQLAERVAKYFGHEQVSITAVTTPELAPPAERPLNGGLSAAKFNAEFPDFRWSNVDDYLKQLKNTSNKR